MILGAWFAAVLPVLADFHVAPNGNDSWPGTQARPFATLERARDAARDLKQAGKMPGNGLTIWLHGGDYLRTNALDLTAADSGTDTAPIRWCAYRTDRVRLLGGQLLQGWAAVSDPATQERLPTNARSHVLQVNLRALGINDFGALRSRGFGRATTLAHGELFYDHRPMTLARWPNQGEFARIAGYPAGQKDEHGGPLGPLSGGFFYSGDRPRAWRDTSDLWVHGYWAYDWANSYEKVALLDVERRFVQTAPPHGLYGFRKDQRFYFLNVLEELDQPGEWYLDRASGLLYFWPPDRSEAPGRDHTETAQPRARHPGSPPTPLKEVVFSCLSTPLLRLTNVSHVTFQGLVLEATRGNAVEIHGGTRNRVAGCLLRNIGNNGVVITGGTGHGVVDCDVLDTGDAGVWVSGGDRQTLTPAGHFVQNCHFQRQGRWTKCYVPAIHLQGVGLRATHNLIQDHPHCAILFGGNDHLIEFNEIHHIALETGDVGAIYTGRDYTYRGNRIRHNFIHHTGGVGMGSMGVYMDDCVSGTEVFGNVFYKVHWAMFIGGGRDHRVENNLFVDCDPAVRMDGRGLDRSPVWRNMVNDTMRRRLKAVPAALYRARYPELQGLDRYYGPPDGPEITDDAFHGVPPENNVVARNVCAGKWIEIVWHATPAHVRLDTNLTNALTSLARPVNDASPASDFLLRPDSPAWALGFQRIPVEDIGLRHTPLRRQLPRLHGERERAR